MPKGIYDRKKKKAGAHKVQLGTVRHFKGDDVKQITAFLRAQRTKAEDRVVAFGTAIEALEVLEA